MVSSPVRKVIRVLRAWLTLLVAVMIWNALVASSILFHGWGRPLPFASLAALATWWLIHTWHTWSVIVCASGISIGVLMRAAEVLVYAHRLDIAVRLTGASLWIAIAGTTVTFGILNVLAISKRSAEETLSWSKH